MAIAGINNEQHSLRKSGRDPVSKHKVQPECANEEADAGRDIRICLAGPKFQARTGTEIYSFFLSS